MLNKNKKIKINIAVSQGHFCGSLDTVGM